MTEAVQFDSLDHGPRAARLWLLRGLTVAGLIIAGYLTIVSWILGGVPLGCGAETGCGEVLASKWARLWGMPVSAVAMAVYIILLAALTKVRAASPASANRRPWWIVQISAIVIAGAAAWFIALQWLVVDAFCPWCMADHSVGVLIALITFGGGPVKVSGRIGAIGLGVVLVAGLAGAQMSDQGKVHHLDPTTPNANVSDPFSGAPCIGSVDAPHTVYIMLDYCCPHCRVTHDFLRQIMESQPDRYRLVLLPMPLNPACNPHTEFDSKRFAHACTLARIALAVWRADRGTFEAFDRWLYEPELPRDPELAKLEAIRVSGAARFAAAQGDPWVDQTLKQYIDAWGALDTDRVPVVMAGDMPPIVGRADSREALVEALDAAFDRSTE